MANPINVECPEGVWTKIFTAQTSGTIEKIRTSPSKYLFARKDTGSAAPVGLNPDGAIPFFIGIIRESFGAKSGSDGYIYPLGDDGEVLVDV